MIKRIAVMTLLLMYVCTTVGFAMSLHFCGTKISNIRINESSKKSCCSKETETKPDRCCKDQHIKIKISDQQQAAQPAKIPAASNIDLLLAPHRTYLSRPATFIPLSSLPFRWPPVTSLVSLNIQNRNFRI